MDGDLIILEDGIPIFNPVARNIPEFRIVIERARKLKNGSHKGQQKLATDHLSYVWFMEHFMSPYQERYPDNENLRDEKVRKRLKLEDWNALNDKEIVAARKAYAGDPSYNLDERLLKNARILANMVADQFEALVVAADPNSTDLAKRPKALMRDLREVGDIIDDLREAEKRARKSENKSVLFGKKTKNVFEDPS